MFEFMGIAIAFLIVYAIVTGFVQDDKKKRDEKENKKEDRKILLITIAVFAVLVLWFTAISMDGGSDSGTKKNICGYCGKSYSITSSNGRNIARTRLCNTCYAAMDSYNNAVGD